MIKIELPKDAVDFILQVLGELPSKTGAWPLIIDIKGQVDPQVNKEAAPEA